MPHIADTDRDSKQPCSGDVSYSFSAGAYFDHLDSAHYHPEAASAPSGSTILRQLQHHLGLPSATEHLIPTTVEPHAPLEPTTEDVETSA